MNFWKTNQEPPIQVKSLIEPFRYLANYDPVTTPAGLAELSASKLDHDLLRLCVGCEPVEKIIAAISEALE